MVFPHNGSNLVSGSLGNVNTLIWNTVILIWCLQFGNHWGVSCCSLRSIDAHSLILSFHRWQTWTSLDIFRARKLGLATKRTNLYPNKESAETLSLLPFICSSPETRFLPLFRGQWISVKAYKSSWIAWVWALAVINYEICGIVWKNAKKKLESRPNGQEEGGIDLL